MTSSKIKILIRFRSLLINLKILLKSIEPFLSTRMQKKKKKKTGRKSNIIAGKKKQSRRVFHWKLPSTAMVMKSSISLVGLKKLEKSLISDKANISQTA